MQEDSEINDKYLHEISDKKDIQMDIAMHIISNDRTARNDTIQGLKEFNQQSPTTQVKKEEQLVSMMPAFKKAFDLLGDDIVDLSVGDATLKNKIGSCNNQQWLELSEAKLVKQTNDDKKKQIYLCLE